MNQTELYKRVADVLGVSSSQKELAFDILTESIVEILAEGVTLKIPRIGFFQLKSDSLKKNETKQLMFSSLPEDYDREEKVLYHTFDINPKYKNSSEVDSQVFSIGVGKPLLPLHDEESRHDSETSFAMLRKSIEERVKELIAESDQIPNFNIWEDVFNEDNDDPDKQNDSSSQFYDLTKDLDFIIENDKEEVLPSHNENFLNSLLGDNKPEASEEFFAEEKKDLGSIISVSDEQQQLIEDDIYKIEEETSSPDLSVMDLLDDVDWMKNLNQTIEVEQEIERGIEEPIAAPEELVEENSLSDPIEETEVEDDEAADNFAITGKVDIQETSEEEFRKFDDNDLLKNLLSDEEVSNDEERDENSEITIEPPSSAKNLLFTSTFEDPAKIKDAWAIEEEDLKGIINEELREYDHEKIANDNSRVLNDLLEDVSNRRVELESTDEYDEDTPVEESNNENELANKIEWSWGDELKEEFGVSQEDEIEIVPENSLLLNFEQIENSVEPDPIQFDLEKTRQDLFSRLQKTLEKEVTSLRDDFDVYHEKEEATPKFTSESRAYTKYEEPIGPRKTKVEEYQQPVVEFKDEKVILDFKTPPPRYEFIEEPSNTLIEQDFPEPPVLTKPKRMTILLERDELESAVKSIAHEPEENVEELPVRKNNFQKYFILSVSALVVVSAVAIYLFFRGSTNNKETKSQQPIENQQENISGITSDQNVNVVTRESLGLNPDDFSEFPTTATPPTPIKEGNSLDLVKLPGEKNVSIPNNEEVLRQSQKDELARKSLTAQSKQPSSGESRLKDMVFFDGKSYNFQISSWKNKALAEGEVNNLRKQGFNAFLVEAFLPDKGGTWYRIRIGSFNSEQEALEFKKKNSF
ncbi:MAG: SPOR domain-containing protein [Melioribacteraceae bacterium]